jgi:hypothetical protein
LGRGGAETETEAETETDIESVEEEQGRGRLYEEEGGCRRGGARKRRIHEVGGRGRASKSLLTHTTLHLLYERRSKEEPHALVA